MQDHHYSELNYFLVKVFQTILRIEEKTLTNLGAKELSMREIHIIEAVSEAEDQNNISAVAETLGVTVGTLTVAVNTLEKKGYIVRLRDEKDKRKVRLSLTEKAYEINELHRCFHHEMVEAVLDFLSPEEAQLLLKSLLRITVYFDKKNTITE